jgi:hypothetical protein
MKWVCPVFLLTIFGCTVMTDVFGFSFVTMSFGDLSGNVLDLIGGSKAGQSVAPNLAAQISMVMVLVLFVFFGLITARSRAYARAQVGLNKHDA